MSSGNHQRGGSGWGVEPTEPEAAVPVSRRVGGRTRVEWRGTGTMHAASIEHYDKRLWQCQIGPLLTDDEELRRWRYCGRMLTAGCEPLRMLGRTLYDVKQLVERFANMAESSYRLLVSDADSTTEHPCPGEIVQVTIRREFRRKRGFLPNDYNVEVREETRVGRANGFQVILFPSIEEVLAVLSDLDTSAAQFVPVDHQRFRNTPAALVDTQRTEVMSRRADLSVAARAVENAILPERSNRAIRL